MSKIIKANKFLYREAILNTLILELSRSYRSELRIADWLKSVVIAKSSFSELCQYYRLVVLAHKQKIGLISGYIDEEIHDYEDPVLESLVTTNLGRYLQIKDAAIRVILLQIVHIKIARYRSLSLYADCIGEKLAGSILRRMFKEEMNMDVKMLEGKSLY